jgi:hypothetical protein
MDFDVIRPVISGLVGAIITGWLVSRWARTLPPSYRGKTRTELARQHRASVRAANGLFLVGLLVGVGLYSFPGFASTDWRPACLGFGLASVMPLFAIAVISRVRSKSLKEAYVAFALGQDTPIWATYGILGAGVVAFCFAVSALLN